jgi:predicted ATPase
LTSRSLGERTTADLIHLPEMVDQEKIALLKTFTHIVAPAYFLNPELFALIVCNRVNRSLQYGNCRYSAFAYSSYGIILLNSFSKDTAKPLRAA